MTTKSNDTEDGPWIRPFADFLQEQGKGKTHDELSAELHKLVTAVHETGKKGQLVFTVTIQPMKKNPDVLEVTDVTVLKLPKHDKKASIFYANDGNLSRTDPQQLTLDGPLRDVSATDQPTSKEKHA